MLLVFFAQDGFKEGQTNEIQLPTITGKLLEKAGGNGIDRKPLEVIEYLYFKYKYTDAKAGDIFSKFL